MQVAVSGASGFIGSAVVRQLVADGREVRALVEPRRRRATSTRSRPRRSSASSSTSATTTAWRGRSTARRRTTTSPRSTRSGPPIPSLIYRVNVEGTTTSLLAAQAAGVREDRLHVVDRRGRSARRRRALGRDGGVQPPRHRQRVPAHQDALRAHRAALRAGAADRRRQPGVPLRPARRRADADRQDRRSRSSAARCPAYGPGGFCAIDVDDVAAAHVAAETKGRVGERYILGDHNITFRDFCDARRRGRGREGAAAPLPRVARRAAPPSGSRLWADHVIAHGAARDLQVAWPTCSATPSSTAARRGASWASDAPLESRSSAPSAGSARAARRKRPAARAPRLALGCAGAGVRCTGGAMEARPRRHFSMIRDFQPRGFSHARPTASRAWARSSRAMKLPRPRPTRRTSSSPSGSCRRARVRLPRRPRRALATSLDARPGARLARRPRLLRRRSLGAGFTLGMRGGWDAVASSSSSAAGSAASRATTPRPRALSDDSRQGEVLRGHAHPDEPALVAVLGVAHGPRSN